MMKIKLSDAFDLQMGKTPSRNEGAYWGGCHKWVSIADISGAEKYIRTTKERITDRGVEESGIKTVPKGSVIMSFKLSIGKTAITAEDMFTNEAIMAFIDKHIVDIDASYLYYLFSGTDWTAGSNRAVMGLTLNKAVLSQREIDIPPLEAQLSAVKTLDKISGLITLRKRQLAKLDELVKSQFVERFGAYSDDTVKTGSILYGMRNGVSPSTNGTYHEQILTLSAFTQGEFNADFWKSRYFENLPPAEKRIAATDFYICRGNGNKTLVGTGVYSKNDRPDLIFPDTVIAAHIDPKRVCLPYLYNAWKQPSVRNQIEANARTTNGTFKINQKVISNIDIVLPPLDLQKRFAAFAEQSDKSKLAIRRGLDRLETLKAALMRQYFT